jgi:hypothetical protein
MASCVRCNAVVSPAELLFASNGDSVCKRCFFAEQTAVQNQRAADSLAAASPGLVPAKDGTPGGTMLAGAGLMALALLWLLAGLFFVGRIYFFPFVLLAVGFAAFARGWALRPRR